ncbi:hypothetical protein M9H77_31147 [Catharanthus roseus]|uniref:Uncharacterized protein n=1 Tax=Catharanthus roseus TaxID=4058 RepID=A0ACC0A136_CATRO|nr:hypothetical protein M9H77_31147 [Catharanthus roseus]
MYQEVSVTRNLNRAPSKPVWQDVKELMKSLQLPLNSVEKNLGNMERRLDQREREYAKGGEYRNLGYQQYDEGDSYYQIGQSCWKKNKMMGKDFRVGYETYEGSRSSYMDSGYGHWYPYEQEARYYGKETYESQESMKSFLYEEKKKEERKTCAQKKVRFEGQLREIGVMSNEHIGKKTSIGEPSGPWSKKSEIEESARSQEVMLHKNDICEGKESHERIERVEESEGISVEYYFLDAIPSLFEKNFQDKRKRIGGKLHHKHKETSISFSSNSLPLRIEFSFKELKLFLNAHVSHEDAFRKLFKALKSLLLERVMIA